MVQLLVWLGSLLGVNVGSGFLVLAQRFTWRFILVTAAVVAAGFAYVAVKTLVNNISTQAATHIAQAGADTISGGVMGWAYCLLPSSTGDAVTVWFSAYASFAALNFYWQVLKMKGGAF